MASGSSSRSSSSSSSSSGRASDKAFYSLELHKNGKKVKKFARGIPRGVSVDLRDYTIDYAQFCHEPLSIAALDLLVTAIKVPEFLLVRMPHKVVDKVKELNDEEPEEIIPGLPSGHHRYIRFRTLQYYGSNRIWGTMERLSDGPICALYKSEKESVRLGGRITQKGLLPLSDTLELTCTNNQNVNSVFLEIGYNGAYHLTDNNCIHYALECWKSLGGKATWNEVVDGHNSYLPGDYDAAGRDCTVM